MEYQKITKLLGNIPDKAPRFITKKWIKVYDWSGTAENRCKPSKHIRLKTSMLRSDFCDYSDAYIFVKWTITVARGNNDAYDKKLAFKNNAPFITCISKINNTCINNTEDLDTVMPMYNLLEHSRNYRKTTEVYGIIIEMNQITVQSLLNIQQVLHENWEITTEQKMLKLLYH